MNTAHENGHEANGKDKPSGPPSPGARKLPAPPKVALKKLAISSDGQSATSPPTSPHSIQKPRAATSDTNGAASTPPRALPSKPPASQPSIRPVPPKSASVIDVNNSGSSPSSPTPSPTASPLKTSAEGRFFKPTLKSAATPTASPSSTPPTTAPVVQRTTSLSRIGVQIPTQGAQSSTAQTSPPHSPNSAIAEKAKLVQAVLSSPPSSPRNPSSPRSPQLERTPSAPKLTVPPSLKAPPHQDSKSPPPSERSKSPPPSSLDRSKSPPGSRPKPPVPTAPLPATPTRAISPPPTRAVSPPPPSTPPTPPTSGFGKGFPMTRPSSKQNINEPLLGNNRTQQDHNGVGLGAQRSRSNPDEPIDLPPMAPSSNPASPTGASSPPNPFPPTTTAPIPTPIARKVHPVPQRANSSQAILDHKNDDQNHTLGRRIAIPDASPPSPSQSPTSTPPAGTPPFGTSPGGRGWIAKTSSETNVFSKVPRSNKYFRSQNSMFDSDAVNQTKDQLKKTVRVGLNRIFTNSFINNSALLLDKNTYIALELLKSGSGMMRRATAAKTVNVQCRISEDNRSLEFSLLDQPLAASEKFKVNEISTESISFASIESVESVLDVKDPTVHTIITREKDVDPTCCIVIFFKRAAIENASPMVLMCSTRQEYGAYLDGLAYITKGDRVGPQVETEIDIVAEVLAISELYTASINALPLSPPPISDAP